MVKHWPGYWLSGMRYRVRVAAPYSLSGAIVSASVLAAVAAGMRAAGAFGGNMWYVVSQAALLGAIMGAPATPFLAVKARKPGEAASRMALWYGSAVLALMAGLYLPGSVRTGDFSWFLPGLVFSVGPAAITGYITGRVLGAMLPAMNRWLNGDPRAGIAKDGSPAAAAAANAHDG